MTENDLNTLSLMKEAITDFKKNKLTLYRSCFKNWEFDKETFKILCSERVTIAREARREREQEF